MNKGGSGGSCPFLLMEDEKADGLLCLAGISGGLIECGLIINCRCSLVLIHVTLPQYE